MKACFWSSRHQQTNKQNKQNKQTSMNYITRSQAKKLCLSTEDIEKHVRHLTSKKRYHEVTMRPPKDTYQTGTFDAIPSAVLAIIQSFLSTKEYRSLLGCNAEIFQQIRYETIYYGLGGYLQKNMDYGTVTERRNYWIKLFTSVKDKSHQIGLRLKGKFEQLMKHYGEFMSGLHRLALHCGKDRGLYVIDPDDYPLSDYFQNIHYLSLQSIGCVRLEGLQRIHTLIVRECIHLIEIRAVTPPLQKLQVAYCDELRIIENAHEIDYLILEHSMKIEFPTNLKLKGRIECLTFDVDYNWENFHEVSSFKLYLGTFPTPPWKLFRNLVELVLFGWGRGPIFEDCLPEDYFPNLMTGKFSYCVFTDISMLRNAKQLEFTRSRLPSADNLNWTLFLHLEEIVFDTISSLTDVTPFQHLKKIELLHCPNISDISLLGTVPKLRIHSCDGVRSLGGLGKGNMDVTICSSLIEDFSSLRSVRKVGLNNCILLKNGSDLANVSILKLHLCSGLEDVSMLGEVQSLHLFQCSNVTNLKNLGNIPFLTVAYCKELKDISDLNGNQSVLIYNCLGLPEAAVVVLKNSNIPFLRILNTSI